MKTRLSLRVLSLLLVAALLTGLAAPVQAYGPGSEVTFTQVDNSAVSVSPIERTEEELHGMVDHLDTDVVRVSIILEQASTIKAGFSTLGIAENASAMSYRDSLKADQDAVVHRIEAATGSKLDVVWNLTLAANLISANVRYGQIEAIRATPGIKGVYVENEYQAIPVENENSTNMATSGSQTGSILAWAEGYTGAGTRIAVVDTGTDSKHQSLNAAAFEHALSVLAQEKGVDYEAYVASLDLLDADGIAAVADKLNVTVDPEAAYLNTKLPFAFNYRDFDYDTTHANDEEGEHGSHVAGIATANTYIPSGEGFAKALESVYVQGVAPEAQLLTMKVFGKQGSPHDSDYMAAIEDAIILGADVVNLSLGSVAPGRGTHDSPVLQQIMDDLSSTDTVVAISAGNSGPWSEMAENGGYLYSTDVSLHTVGQPGSFTNSLAVASVENDGMVGYYVTVGGQMIVYNEDNRDGQFTNQPFTSIAGEHEYIFLDGVGKAEDWAAVADVLKGKIALCSRGETNFVEKATLAVEAGAKAVFIYNNQSGMITLDLTEYTYSNPVAALSKVQGDIIRAASTPVTDAAGNVLYRTGKMTVSDTIGLGTFDSEFETMSSFSSWGVPGSLEMKPEITAPGGNIYSIQGATPENGGDSDDYRLMSGTSMASPQVAGMAALMAQYIHENGLVEKTGMTVRHLTQSLLMSTAKAMQVSEGVYYPILQQGAGLANVHDAMSAESFVTMAPGSSAGDADGKVKVELYDDPQKTGSYSASFTVTNLSGEAKNIDLSADFFTQALLSDGEFDYLDYTTAMLPMNVTWTVGGVKARSMTTEGMDFNGDGTVDAADGQAILDYATGLTDTLANFDLADVDADGDVDSHDAYVFLKGLSTTTATLPANGSVDITVKFSLSADTKAELEKFFPNGTYIQGFLFAEVEGDTAHSIPVLGFYGNWTDPGMFDLGQWPTFATGEDKRIPYIGRTRGNDFKVMYDWDPGYNYSFGGNPILPDAKYMPERNAMNSADTMDGVSFIAIRHADQSRVQITNETSGKVIMDQATGPVNMAYYYGALGWQNSGLTLTTNFSLENEAEGDLISMGFTLIPEYYIDEDGMVDFDALGKGATISTTFTIDNTAPELHGVSIDIMNNTMTVKASDNRHVAGVGLYNKTGTRTLAQTGAKQDIEMGEMAEYSFSLDKVNGKKFLLQVFDYAMNRATYLIEMQIGESTDLPTMMAYDLVSHHWAGFDKTFEYDYKVGTPRIAYADHVYYAATIAEHYVFASTNKGELYVMPEDDLSDITFITDLEMVLYDMAYNQADGEVYAVNEMGELISFHKLTGEVTKHGKIGLNTNTLACDADGIFYCNELGTGKVYSFTLDTMDEPLLLMEDPYLTHVDPIMGADMGGTTGNMGMEYDPNTGKICWNSHCEVLIGSYITYAYFYEIDPVNGQFTRYADFWHEMSGLIIPDRRGGSQGWADPTDKVIAVKLNKSEIDVIRGTSAQLIANVQPWTATDRTVTWTSADESIATVNKYGVVTGLKEGTTTIRATSNLDPKLYAECTVNVEILDVTLHGTLSDKDGNSMFYDWDMSQEKGWTAGASIAKSMTSATYSDAQKVYYMMDNEPSKWMMHKVAADGTILESSPNTNSIAFWDMTYNPYFSKIHGEEQISSIYYYYLLSPKNPMNMNAVGFNLGDLADYLVGITSLGYELQYDENGTAYDTEHLVLLDNDGYIWDFWIYDVASGGMNALYNITKSNISCEFAGDDTMDNLYTSLMAGEDGNLYLSTFTGTTNEIWHMSYDADVGQYVAVKLGDVGENVWPATITSVTVNGSAAANTASPEPMYTMAAEKISQNELKAAASRASFSVSQAELDHKLAVKAAGTQADPAPFVIGDNTVTAPKTGYFYTYTAEKDGTATISSEGVDWRATTYINGELSGNTIHNPKYDGSVITRDLTAGDVLLFKITPYSGYSAVAREITVNFGYVNADGTVPGNPGIPDPEPTEPEPTDPTDPEPSEPVEGENPLALGTNALVSGTKYTYTSNADGRLEFDFVIKDAEGKQIYQYAYGKGTRVKIFVNGNYVPNVENTKVTVSKGQTVTVELQSVDGGEYTANLTLSALAAATKLVIGDNNIATKTDYSFIADRDGTLYTTIKELWCDGTYCSDASLSSSVVFKINGVTVYGFENAYEVKAGDEITVTMGIQFIDTAKAVLNLSWDGFYKHPAGSRGNPFVLDYSEFPTTVEIPAGEAHWYKLTGFYSGYYMDIYGENAYVVISGKQYNVSANGLRIPAVTSLQIGNSGTTTATFELYAGIEEGTSGNPKDLVNGKQTVELEPSKNYYYDFVATQAGSATFTVSGDNWRFFYSLIGADGTALITDEDHRMVREGDSDTVTVDLSTGQTIIIKLATMNSSWSSTGGELTVDFHFTPADGACTHDRTEVRNAVDASCDKEGYTGDTYCLDCGVRIKLGESIPVVPHTPGDEATCHTPQICTVCSEELVPALGHEYVDGFCIRCGEEEPTVDPEYALTLGTNELASGLKYNYAATEEGRLEFDFIIKDADGKQIYQYAYGKGERVKIMINGSYVANLVDTKISVRVGDVVNVELVSVDGGEYTATLTLTGLAPATKLILGDNKIAKDVDYSYIATKNGTLYLTIKELICDNAYCSEVSLGSSVVFKINGTTVYGFENSYEVKAGDEITVRMGTQFGEPASAVLNMSYDGFYKHPLGSRGNPIVIDYANMPTYTPKIPAGTAYWFKFANFPASADIKLLGAEGCYVIYAGETYVIPEGKAMNIGSVRNIQIGNSGTGEASFYLYYDLKEGTVDNPKDLVKGANTVTLDKSANYYYDFVAQENGTATFTVSGDNWRFFYSLLSADGSAIVSEEDHQAKRGDADTITVDMTAGQSILLKLGTLNSSWTAPGGELTVHFNFEADGTAEPELPENPLVLGKNDLTSGTAYGYVVPADGRMEFSIGSVYNSANAKQYSWWNGTKLNILIDGKAMTSSSAKRNVKAGQVITVMIESLDGDTYTADMTLKEIAAAETLKLGQNSIAQDLEHVYTAERDGTLYISMVEMLYNGKPVTESALGSSVQMTINGSSVSSFNKSYNVKTGDEIAIVVKDYSWDGSGVVNTTISLSYEGFFEHPAGSLMNPVELLYADCPTKSIRIDAGAAAWYELEGDPGDYSTPSHYPFKGKTLVVTGANAYVIVDNTRHDAVNGVVKVEMNEQTMIQIGNAGNSAATFDISVEIPEGHVDNPQDLVEGENKISLPSYGTHHYDFHATANGTATVTVSGENWKYTFAHYAANGEKLSTKDYYAKNGDSDTVELELKAGEYIVITVGTSKGYSQPGGDITVTFHFEAEAVCEHTNTTTTVENEIPATCTKDGSYETVVTCSDCGAELSREKTVVPALGHEYEGGVCGNCGEPDPNAPDNTVKMDVVADVTVTNGVITLTWDPAKLTLTDFDIHADYTSVIEGEGSLTFGYVALRGIESGKAIASLTFEAVDPEDVSVTVEHSQRNNEGTQQPDPKPEVMVVASGWSGYTSWKLTSDGTLTFSPTEMTDGGQTNLKNYWKVNGVLTLPWTPYAEQITKVVIEEGIHDIGQMAFYEMPNLTEVVLPESAVEIRHYAFKNCKSLTTINLEVVDEIREGAFYGCSALKDVTFAEGVLIEDWAFTKTTVQLP